MARHRFFSAEDIDGGGLGDGTTRAKLLQALVQNTLEQTVLAVIAYGAWLYLAAPGAGAVVSLCVASFSLGRLLFSRDQEGNIAAAGQVGRNSAHIVSMMPDSTR